MKTLRRLALFVLVVFAGASLSLGQSLAEVAKKEKERRKNNKEEASRVITDRDLSQGYGGLPSTRGSGATAGAQTEGAESGEDASPAGEEEGEEQQDETQTREYWQQRVQQAREKITQLEQRLESEDWGEGQRYGVDPRGLNNLTRRQELEQQLAAARSELNAIRAEARRAGVPPGWVR